MNSVQSASVQQYKRFSDEEIRAAFQTFDLDKNMSIGVSEIRHVLSLIGESASEEEIDEMIRLCDSDGAGQVSFDGFHRLFTTPIAHAVLQAEYRDGMESVLQPNMNVSNSLPSVTISKLLAEYTTDIDINPGFIRKVYKRFQTVDKSRSGRIGYEDFLQVMESDDTNLMRQLFDQFDFNLMNEIDVKQFIVNLIIHSKSIKMNEKVKISFSMIRTSNCPENSMDLTCLRDLILTFFSGFPEELLRMDPDLRAEAVFQIAGVDGAFINQDQLMDVILANPELVLPPIMIGQVGAGGS
jgi:Ca2+-binding EF-hand superfamily protein